MQPAALRFLPRWKEELVVTAPGGKFILDLPMGIFSACLPTQAAWRRKAPPWAQDLWPQLRAELEVWCRQNNAKFIIDERAGVHEAT